MGRSSSKHPAQQEFGRRLRDRRARLGLTQEGLAERAGIHPTYLASVERGERNVSLVNILRLARAVRLDPADLVQGLQTQEVHSD